MANHDDIRDLEVGTLEIGPSSQLAIVRWITIQNVYSHLELVFFWVPRSLELTEVWDFTVKSSQFWARQLNVYPF